MTRRCRMDQAKNCNSLFQHFAICVLLTTTVKASPQCDISRDTVLNGLLVNCTDRHLSLQNLKELKYKNGITTLVISLNYFGSLPNNSFSGFQHLKRLDCQKCGLQRVDVDTFQGLSNLEVLNLETNHLKLREFAFPKGCFRHVSQLKKLFLQQNDNYGNVYSYSEYIDIFKCLPHLTDLTIDSFSNLRIGEEFVNLTKLENLQVNCMPLKSIENESLKGFEGSSVKRFEMSHGEVFKSQIGVDVFQHLPNVSYLSLNSLHIGNRVALRMMKPLVGKQIDTIKLSAVYSPWYSALDQKTEDGIITVDCMKYLSTVMVSNFYWYESRIISFDSSAFLSPTWQKYLERIVFQTNELVVTNFILFFKVALMKKLESVSYLNMGAIFVDQFNGYPSKIKNEMEKHERHFVVGSEARINSNRTEECNKDRTNKYIIEKERAQTLFRTILQVNSENNQRDYVPGDPVSNGVRLRLPPSLKHIQLVGLNNFRLNQNVWLVKNGVRSVSLQNFLGVVSLQGKLFGLNCLTSVSLGNSRIDIALDFFDTFPGLRSLRLRKLITAPEFLHSNCKRLVQNLVNLQYLDISDNDLRNLAPGTFKTNKQLKYLSLANNKLSQIPFDLKLTPKLEILDLRGNFFVDLSREERAAIDDHINRVSHFTILFGDNALSCSCSRLSFISWFQSHADNFDQGANYTCTSTDGSISYTANFRDVAGLWRLCLGEYYLMLSLILFCAFIAGYLAIFLGMKNKTQIVSKVLQMVVKGFRLKTRKDFSIDVCIGYANQDWSYVRNVLLRYLEDRWRLTTFVHQRDLLQDPLLMSQAIQGSWRCLLLITDDFLHHYDMAHNVMKVAAFFVSPSNPKSIVVLVEENVQHQIPDYVLQVVDEDNIIVLNTLRGTLDYETKEFLRTRLTL